MFDNNSVAIDRSSFRESTFNLVRILCKQRQGIRVCHINAQSLIKKIDEFRYIFEGSDIDVVCVSETWFYNELPDSFVSINGYKIIRADRHTHAGGVAIYIRNNINYWIKLRSEKECSMEYVFMELALSTHKALIGVIYRPNNNVDVSNLLESLASLSSMYNDVIVTGDLNSNMLQDKSLINDFASLGISPVNSCVPTHFTGNNSTLLDYFLINDLSKVLLYDQLSVPNFSKHDLIFLTVNLRLSVTSESFEILDFKNVDYDRLFLELPLKNWDAIYSLTTADEKLEHLNSNILQLTSSCIPKKTIIKKNISHPWFNESIKRHIELRDHAYRRWKRFRTNELYTEYKNLRKTVVSHIKKAKKSFFREKFSNITNTQTLWKEIRCLGHGSSLAQVGETVDPDEINMKFASHQFPPAIHSLQTILAQSSTHVSNDQFEFHLVDQYEVFKQITSIKSKAVGLDGVHPKFILILLPFLLPYITHIFNFILMSSSFPAQWKIAKIIPVPKSNHDLRPIAILPFLSKALEKIMHSQISEFLNYNNMLFEKQSGFRSKHSCTTALCDVSEDIRSALDSNNISILVLLDHTKAFDSLHPDTMCLKLRHWYNFSTTSCKLLNSYLSGRQQSVIVKNKASMLLSMSRGVPQGSILGPLLFTIYINDLPSVLKFCAIHLYADDVQLYSSSSIDNIDSLIQRINHDLASILNWTMLNGLLVNPNKSKSLCICNRSIETKNLTPITFDGKIIEYVSKAKNLGVVFNDRLNFDDHINASVGKVYGLLRPIRSSQNFTPPSIRLILAKTCILPVLIYGCELFSNCSSSSFNKINVAFNNVTRYICGLGPFDSVSESAKNVLGISFKNYLIYRTLIFLHNVITTQTPAYLYNRLRFALSARSNILILPRHLRSASEKHFFINSL